MSSIKRQWLRKTWSRVGTLLLLSSFSAAGLVLEVPGQKGNEAEKGSFGQSAAMSVGLTRPQMEEFLLTARIVQHKALSVGVTNSQRATLDDGKLKHDAHIQTVDISKDSFQTVHGTEMNFRDSYKFNMAAYELDKLWSLTWSPCPSNGRSAGTWPLSPGGWMIP